MITTLKDKKIVVTGATGLVGGHLVAELLREGCSLRLLMRESSHMDHLRSTLQRLEVPFDEARLERVNVAFNNPHELAEALRGYDVVFHCAARVSFDRSEEVDIVECNTELAQHIANASLECGVKLLVYVSSVAALGEAIPQVGAVTEKSELSHCGGRSLYSVSKFFAENAIRRAMAQGLPTIIVNPSVILGEGDPHSSSVRMMGALIRWGRWGYTSGAKGYVDVRDVARGMVTLAKCPEAVGHRFILSGGNLSFQELQSLVARAAGHRVPRIAVSPALLRGVTGMLRNGVQLFGLEFPLSETLVSNMIDQTFYDGSLIGRLTGFQYTPLVETIHRVVTGYLTDQQMNRRGTSGC